MTKCSNKLNNVYLKIDGANYFEESIEKEEKEIIAEKERVFNEINDSNNPKIEALTEIVTKYLNKYFPDDKTKDIFSMSQFLSKHFCKHKNLKKKIWKNILIIFSIIDIV